MAARRASRSSRRRRRAFPSPPIARNHVSRDPLGAHRKRDHCSTGWRGDPRQRSSVARRGARQDRGPSKRSAESVCPSGGGSGRDERSVRSHRAAARGDQAAGSGQAETRRERWKDWRSGGSIERAWRNLHSAEILLAESRRPRRALEPASGGPLDGPAGAATDGRPGASPIEQRLSDDEWNQRPGGRGPRTFRQAPATGVRRRPDVGERRLRQELHPGAQLPQHRARRRASAWPLVAIGLGVIGVAQPAAACRCASIRPLTPTNSRRWSARSPDRVPDRWQRARPAATSPLVLGRRPRPPARSPPRSAVRNMRGTSTPYGVPVAIAWLKLPAGALDRPVRHVDAARRVHSRAVRAGHAGTDHRLRRSCSATPSRSSPAWSTTRPMPC